MTGNRKRDVKLSPAEMQAFDIDIAMARIREAVGPFPKAVLFELAADGYKTIFEQLIACIITIRTMEEVSGPAARRLFARARRPEAMAALTPNEIDELIWDVAFHEPKSRQILAITRRVIDQHQGELPCNYDVLLSFNGVGPKCANLALGIACGQPRIGVDIHVHRVTNRWGYIAAATPERTTLALQSVLPTDYWLEINRLLVPFGKYICTGRLPRCSTCPVLDMCQQVGVTSHR